MIHLRSEVQKALVACVYAYTAGLGSGLRTLASWPVHLFTYLSSFLGDKDFNDEL
jgi:hypothetical protein